MPKSLNKLTRRELASTFGGVASGVFVNYTGVSAEDTYSLRKELHENNVKMLVVKTNIAKLAFADAGFEVKDFGKILDGPLALVHDGDPVAVAKLLAEYRRKNKTTTLAVKGGLLDRKVIDSAQVAQLAMLPSRDQLRAQFVGTLAGPIRGLVTATAGIIRKLLYALNAVKDEKGKAGEG